MVQNMAIFLLINFDEFTQKKMQSEQPTLPYRQLLSYGDPENFFLLRFC
jgi:hypothetical protein